MDNQPPSEPPHPALSPEVALVRDAVSCSFCSYFWQAPSRFGPFPSFNWEEDYPIEMRESSGYPSTPTDWMEGRSQAPQRRRASIMDGCRKAPIVTVGINPMLDAYSPDSAGAVTAYPSFRDENGDFQFNRFAYFARYNSIYEAAFSNEFISENLQEEGIFRAEKSGWLLSAERSGFNDGSNQREITLRLLYDNDDRTRTITLTWEEEEQYVVLFDPHSSIVPIGQPQFEAGAVIAGKLDLSTPKTTRLNRCLSGYHERMSPILETFTAIAGTTLRGSELAIGEDVAQLDLIACASPEWSEDFGIDSAATQSIATNCISHAHGKAFAIRQLLHARPAVLLIVGTKALQLFHHYLSRYFPDGFNEQFTSESGELKSEPDAFGFMKACCSEDWFLEIREWIGMGDDRKEYTLRARLLVVPDFSRPENYMPQVRFPTATMPGSTINEWKNYCAKYPEAAQLLESGEPLYPVVMPRVHPDPSGSSINVWLLGEEDPIETIIEYDAWEDLIDSPWYMDPTRQIAQLLLDELDEDRIEFNEETGHLERNEGGCKFCDNALWKFPDGCAYAKPEEESYTAEFLDAVVEAVLWR